MIIRLMTEIALASGGVAFLTRYVVKHWLDQREARRLEERKRLKP